MCEQPYIPNVPLRSTLFTYAGGLLIVLALPSIMAVASLAVASLSGFVSVCTMGNEGAAVSVSTQQQTGVQVGSERVCLS